MGITPGRLTACYLQPLGHLYINLVDRWGIEPHTGCLQGILATDGTWQPIIWFRYTDMHCTLMLTRQLHRSLCFSGIDLSIIGVTQSIELYSSPSQGGHHPINALVTVDTAYHTSYLNWSGWGISKSRRTAWKADTLPLSYTRYKLICLCGVPYH